MPAPDLEAALTDLLGDLILERAFEGAGPDDQVDRYRFRHELLREVAYDLQPPSRRRDLHGRVADALVAGTVDRDVIDWHLVAGHYDAAGRTSDAVDAYERAADRARRLGVLPEARGFLARAIELVTDLPDGRGRRSREVALRLRRGFLAVSAEGNSSPDAVRDYERCLEITRPDTASDEMFGTLHALWAHYMIRGDLARARQITGILHSALVGKRAYYRPDIDASSGAVSWFAGDFAEARTCLDDAAEAFEARGRRRDDAASWFQPADPESSTHTMLALAAMMTGDAGASRHFDLARRVATGLEFPQNAYSEANALGYEVWMHVQLGDLAQASVRVEELAELANRHGLEFWALVAAWEQAQVAASDAIAQRPDDTAALQAHAGSLDQFCAIWRGLDLGLFLPSHVAMAARAWAAAGDIDGARSRLEEALRCAAETGMHFYDAEIMRLRAHLSDDPAPELRAALDIARDQGAVPFELRIASDLFRADPTAIDLVAAAVGRSAADATYPGLDQARAWLSATA
jgi:tetratricopeptide (TPR) repeat protein